MQFGEVTNLQWADVARSQLNCEVAFEDGQVHPFTASADDAEAHSREIFERAIAGEFGQIAAFVAPPPQPPTVPHSVRRRNLKLALLDAEILDDIEAFVAAAPREVQIGWAETVDYLRDDPLLNEMATAFGLTSEQMDGIFIAAAAK